jgi:two-component system, LuxR family, sensor kinase FixL
MAGVLPDTAEELRSELSNLIVRRLRIGLRAFLAGVVLFVVADHSLMAVTPRWADGLNAVLIALAAIALAFSGRPAFRAHAVPFGLLIVAMICGSRALAGIWTGDLVPTAIVCLVVALTAGASLPWGAWPQLASVAIAGLAIASNAYLISGTSVHATAQLIAAVFTALMVSAVLSFELQRNHSRLVEENIRRRRAEDGLARLNAELESRVNSRTAELAAATQRLEREALERQQATQGLRESQKRLQDILDNAAATIYLKDVDGRYQLINRHWETAFGIRREDVVGKTGHDLFPAEVADTLRANDRKVLAARQPLQIEETLVPRGEPRTYLSVKFPLLDSGGTPVGLCGISTDITDLKQTEAELRRSEAALSALVESTTDAIWSVDRTGVVTVMNAVAQRRFRDRFGVDYDPLNYGAQMAKPIRTMLFELFERAFQGEHVQVESSIPSEGGDRHFLLSIHPIVENGVVTGATASSKDITERKHAEEQVRQHQAHLAHVLRLNTMGEMAAGLAHEINQPLGAIANYAQGCTRRLRGGSVDGAELLPIVEEIAHEALRAGEIIRRLRDLVRKEGPQQAAVDLNALVRESTRVIGPEALQSGIRVELALAPDLPPVTCDSIQIEQVLLNLLLNGVEAVQTSGNGERSLTITTAAAGAAGIEVAIRDSGCGVPDPPADVFKPFFSTKPNGLGMGLSISRSIIEAHGGRLWATRNPDHGSTFRFTLPLERAPAA